MSEFFLGAVAFGRAMILPILSGMLTMGLITGNQRFNAWFALALGYAVGMGVLGQLILLMGWLDLPLNTDTVSCALLIYSAVMSVLFLLRQRFFPHQSINFSKNEQGVRTWIRTLFFVVLLAYITYQLCYIFWNAFYMPISQADAFSVHAYKAKVIYYTHNLKQPSQFYLNPKSLSYPLQVPLAMAWVAFNIGQWHEGWAQMVVALNSLVFVVITYNFMKYWTDRLTALLINALMLSSLFFVLHASIAYFDFTIMFYTTVSLLLIGWGAYNRCISFIVLGGLMSAFAASVKLEGVAYWILEVVLLCRFIFAKEFFDFRFVLKALVGFIFPFIIMEINFLYYKAHYGIAELWSQGHYFDFSLSGFWERMFAMARALTDNLFLSGNWNILWFFLIAMGLANRKQKKTFAVSFFNLSLGLFFINYFMAVEFTNTSFYLTDAQTPDSLSRLLLHFYPLCPLLIGLLIHGFLKNKRSAIAEHPVELL